MHIVPCPLDLYDLAVRKMLLVDFLFVLHAFLTVQEQGWTMELLIYIEACNLVEILNKCRNVYTPLHILVICSRIVHHVAGHQVGDASVLTEGLFDHFKSSLPGFALQIQVLNLV